MLLLISALTLLAGYRYLRREYQRLDDKEV
jgi:hypothetical protein